MFTIFFTFSAFANWATTMVHGEPTMVHAENAVAHQLVTVATIDTGIDPSQLDLKGKIWHDPESPNIYGWDFVNNRPNPYDRHGHGTHIAGIIGAFCDQSHDVCGMTQDVSLMAIKYYDPSASGANNLRRSVQALHYAIDHGARVINYSGGGPSASEEEEAALRRAENRGILVVTAAGNEHSNTDVLANAYYPSAYHLRNIISVAAVNASGSLLSASNYGVRSVDVAAPGDHITSTLPDNSFGVLTGTSQATAFVTGLAALMLSKNPSLQPEEIKRLILEYVTRVPALTNVIASGGIINVAETLRHVRVTD